MSEKKVFLPVLFFFSVLVLSIFSYGFLDPGLMQFVPPYMLSFVLPLRDLVFEKRTYAAGIYTGILCMLSWSYILFLRRVRKGKNDIQQFKIYIATTVLLLIFSYPAFSYDIFNYITTAKLTFFHQENPYVVMPVEIPNEPYLSFTRAANKFALYGPSWIAVTYIPHILGLGNIWATIVSFKVFIGGAYLLLCYCIWKQTKSVWNTLYFSLNPLVLIETLVSGHNDVFMMLLLVFGVGLFFRSTVWSKIGGLAAYAASVFVKGATLPLFPLFFIKMEKERFFFYAWILLSITFVIAGPIREELYPWYAIWPLTAAAMLPFPKYRFIHEFSLVSSIGLELRHIPYMATLSYGGWGIIFRFLVSFIPPFFYCLYYVLGRKHILYENKKKK